MMNPQAWDLQGYVGFVWGESSMVRMVEPRRGHHVELQLI